MDVLPSHNAARRQRQSATTSLPSDREHFQGLVDRLVAIVDTAADRRAVSRACTRLLRAASGDSRRLEAAFDADDFSATDYLQLGEIGSALDAVRRRLTDGPASGAPASLNPYAAAPTVHLSAPRIQLYLDGRRDLIGQERVFDRLDAHVAGCDACREAVASRRKARGTPGS